MNLEALLYILLFLSEVDWTRVGNTCCLSQGISVPFSKMRQCGSEGSVSHVIYSFSQRRSGCLQYLFRKLLVFSVARFWSWQNNYFHAQASAIPIWSHTALSFAGLSPVWVVCFQEVCSCCRWLLEGGTGAAFSLFSLDTIAKPYESIMHHPLADPPINNLCPYQLVSIRSEIWKPRESCGNRTENREHISLSKKELSMVSQWTLTIKWNKTKQNIVMVL